MALIKIFNKAANATYVYESVCQWDSELKRSRAQRKLIGKIDPETGEIVPTKKRGSRSKTSVDSLEQGDADYEALYRKALETIKEKDKIISDLRARLGELQDFQMSFDPVLEDSGHSDTAVDEVPTQDSETDSGPSVDAEDDHEDEEYFRTQLIEFERYLNEEPDDQGAPPEDIPEDLWWYHLPEGEEYTLL